MWPAFNRAIRNRKQSFPGVSCEGKVTGKQREILDCPFRKC